MELVNMYGENVELTSGLRVEKEWGQTVGTVNFSPTEDDREFTAKYRLNESNTPDDLSAPFEIVTLKE